MVKELLRENGLPSDHLDKNNENLFLVEDDDGRVGGCACLCIGQLTELRSVCIRADLRGMGCGRRLVGAVLAESRRKGELEVYLRTEATGIFKRFGFRELPRNHLVKWRYCSQCTRRGTEKCRHVPMIWVADSRE